MGFSENRGVLYLGVLIISYYLEYYTRVPIFGNSHVASFYDFIDGIDLDTIGALIIRTGFWGALYFKYNKEPPKIV